MENQYKVLAFDCDGTLLNTIPDYTYCVNKALDYLNLPHITQQEARSFLGYGTDKLLKCSLKGQKEDEFDKFKEFYLNTYLNHYFVDTQIYPGCVEMLTKANKKGYKLAICSNKPDAVLQRLIKAAFPTIEFDYIAGQKNPNIRKPDPLQLNEIIANFNVSKDEIAYFGDTEVDYQFAKNAFVNNVFIVRYGFRDKSYLNDNVKPIEFFNSIYDIIKYFKL